MSERLSRGTRRTVRRVLLVTTLAFGAGMLAENSLQSAAANTEISTVSPTELFLQSELTKITNTEFTLDQALSNGVDSRTVKILDSIFATSDNVDPKQIQIIGVHNIPQFYTMGDNSLFSNLSVQMLSGVDTNPIDFDQSKFIIVNTGKNGINDTYFLTIPDPSWEDKLPYGFYAVTKLSGKALVEAINKAPIQGRINPYPLLDFGSIARFEIPSHSN